MMIIKKKSSTEQQTFPFDYAPTPASVTHALKAGLLTRSFRYAFPIPEDQWQNVCGIVLREDRNSQQQVL